MAVSDLIVSPAKVYFGAVGATPPLTTVTYGTAWAAAWTRIAETAAPVTISYEYDVIDYDIQESLGPVNRKKTAERLKVETTLAAIDLDQLALSWQGAVTNVAQAAGVAGYEQIPGGDIVTLQQYAWGFEGQTAGGFPIRFFIWIATAIAGAPLVFGKAVQTGIPLQLQGINDMSKAAGVRLYRVDRILTAVG